MTQPFEATAYGLRGRLMFWVQRHKGKILSPLTHTALEREGILTCIISAHSKRSHMLGSGVCLPGSWRTADREKVPVPEVWPWRAARVYMAKG